MQALGPDILEAAAHAKTMTQEEIEETIDYLLNEVLPPSVVTADLLFTFFIRCSTGKILLVIT